MQVPLILLLADLLAYWTHRLFHGRWLWPFHAIHHSSTTVDWLSSVRLHPVNDAVARIVQVLPLYWMGFNGRGARGVRAVPDVLRAAPARQRRAGPTARCGTSSRARSFHRWHHTSEDEGLDTNFAGLFPFIDLAFGTFYMPTGRQPQRFGVVSDDVPDGLIGQLVYPFRRRERRVARPTGP